MSGAGKTIPGYSLMIPVGATRRARRLYLAPQDTLQEFLAYSRSHNDHVLWATSMPTASSRIANKCDHIILWALTTDTMLIGRIIDAGRDYSPDIRIDSYGMPEPWVRFPARYWMAIDGLEPLTGFDPTRYRAVFQQKEPMPLAQYLSTSSSSGICIEPIRETDQNGGE